MSRIRALLASLRIANAPSVVSNVWLGYMLGFYFWGSSSPNFWPELGLLSLIALCLLFSGNLLNDWFDRDWDKQHRPERALPSGLLSKRTYEVGIILFSIGALSLARQLGTQALVVTVSIHLFILAYTFLHKRTRWAVIPMGLCRAGLYFLGASLIHPEFPMMEEGDNKFAPMAHQFAKEEWIKGVAFLTTHALGLFAYIVGLTLTARYESTEHPPHGMVVLSRAMLLLPLAAMSCWWIPWYPLNASPALLPFSIWLALAFFVFRKPISRFVSALLAGIPLVDAITAIPLTLALLNPDESLSTRPLLLATLLIPFAAFILGRLLQRLAPAT